MPEDVSSCYELDCCPLSFNVLPIVTSEPLLTEANLNILTESDLPLFT